MIKEDVSTIISQAKQNIKSIDTLNMLLRIIDSPNNNRSQSTEVMHIIAKHYFLNNDFNNAQKYFEQSISESVIANEIDIKSKSLSNLGLIFQLKGDYIKSKIYFEESLELKNQIGDETSIANTLINLGNISVIREEYIEALKYFDTSLKIYERENLTVEYSKCLYNIGVIYLKNESFETAIEYFIDALSNINFDVDSNMFIMININIGNSYLSLDNFKAAEKYLNKALDLSKKTEYTQGEICALSMLGEMYLKENKVQLSKQFCIDTINIQNEIYYDAHSSAYLDLGIIDFQKNNINESIQQLLLSIELCSRHNLIKRKRIVLSWLVKAYEKSNNFNEAFKYQSELMELKEEYHSKKTNNKLEELKYISDKERIEKEAIWHEQKNLELEKEKKRADDLLNNILPEKVAEELKSSGEYKAILHEDVTVMFTDFHEFSHISRLMTPQELVEELHQCFKMFDIIISKYGIEKIKTVGDAYIAVSGLHTDDINHANNMIYAAIEIRNYINNRKKNLGDRTFNIRIGIHSGPLVAGIVGVKKFAYDVWGDTVNIAARIEQNVTVGNISISENTYQKIKDSIQCKEDGEINAKNIGLIKVYTVL